MPNDGGKKDDSCKQICWYLHFPRFRTIFGATFEKNTNFVTQLSRQAHDREICFNPAVVILRRTSHCGETARFLPPFFIGGTQHPLTGQSMHRYLDRVLGAAVRQADILRCKLSFMYMNMYFKARVC